MTDANEASGPVDDTEGSIGERMRWTIGTESVGAKFPVYGFIDQPGDDRSYVPHGWPAEEFQLRTGVEHAGCKVEAWWRIINGRPEPVEVRIRREDGRSDSDPLSLPVLAETIRQLPLGEMLAESRKLLNHQGEQMIEDPGWNGALRKEFLSQAESLAAPLAASAPQRGRALTMDDLNQVAEVYREAWRRGNPVNEAVQNAFYLSKDGAAKRIAKARRAGLLDEVGPKR